MNATSLGSDIFSSQSTNYLAWAILIVVLVAMCASPALGQGVASGAQTGVVQDSELASPEVLVISGAGYTIDEEQTRFTFRGEEVDASVIESGMVVRFIVRDGVLQLVQLLGPDSLVRNIGVH